MAKAAPKFKFKFPKVGRDTILFAGGLLGIAHETLVATEERTTLLLLFATMAGLPAFLRGDEKKDDETVPPPPEIEAAP